ncbi:MAG: response regulator [Burkholderiales bacterium]|nr:response regulator [Burkholderiales bacterium]
MAENAGIAEGKIRILFAEDNPDIARIVAFYLKNMRNTEILPCKDGGEAIAAMSTQKIDLAVLDGNMPVADGVTVLRWMRTQPALVSVPVIFLTANHTATFSDECIAAGAQLVMTKPFNPGLLVRQIRSLLLPGGH